MKKRRWKKLIRRFRIELDTMMRTRVRNLVLRERHVENLEKALQANFEDFLRIVMYLERGQRDSSVHAMNSPVGLASVKACQIAKDARKAIQEGP